MAGSVGWVASTLLQNEWDLHVYFLAEMNVVPTGSLVDGFTLLGSTLLHCGAVLKGFFCLTCCFAVFVVSPLCLQKALSFCEVRFAFFVPRIYFLLSLRAISERIGESPVCDFR